MPRVFLHPGFVRSRYDGRKYYVDCRQLIAVYGLNRYDSLIRVFTNDLYRPGDVPLDDDIHLYPREYGNYPRLKRDKKGHILAPDNPSLYAKGEERCT